MRALDVLSTALSIVELLEREGCYYPRGIGVRKIAESLRKSPTSVISALRLLRRLGVVVRAPDGSRRRFCVWCLSRTNAVKHLLSLARELRRRRSISDWLSALREIDASLDRYYVTGTVALILRGLSWNLVEPQSIMLAVDESEADEASSLAAELSREGIRVSVLKKSLKMCDFELLDVSGFSAYVASVEQAIIDSLANPDSAGVDVKETLAVVLGELVPKWLSAGGGSSLRKMIKLALSQYGERGEEVLSLMRLALMKVFTYFEDADAVLLSLPLRGLRRLPSKIMLRYLEDAMRMTLLGDGVAARLGLEPVFE